MIQTRRKAPTRITFVTFRRKATGKRLGFVLQPGVFDHHVFKLAGLKDVSTLQAFNEFGIFLASHDLHARMLTLIHGGLLGGLRRRD
jgi:hypothetical protein